MYKKIVHCGEASEMENCGNSPKHIRIIWVDYDDMLRVDFPTVPGNAHTIKAVKPERNHSKF